MELSKFNPWNWFKHEEPSAASQSIPLKMEDYASQAPMATGSMWQLHREMDRLFDEAFRGFGLPSRLTSQLSTAQTTSFRPKLNVASDDKQYTISLEAPGLAQQDIKLELNGRTLLIQGEKRFEKEDKDKHYYCIERCYGQFQRVLDVPDDVELTKITAKMDNGVLNINLPRTAQPHQNGQRQIPIQT